MGATLVVSAHLDDAVFSAGQLLAAHPDTVVVTVFAGVPPEGTTDPYDAGCGFPDSAQAVRHRRREDETALSLLGASPVHLDLYGVQYDTSADDELDRALRHTVERVAPRRVIGPVGVVHPDHQRVGAAWRRVLRDRPGVAAYAYEDLPYRATFPRKAAREVDAFVRDHGAVRADLPAGDVGRKACAMLAYHSQLRTSAPLRCLEPEGLWHLPGVS